MTKKSCETCFYHDNGGCLTNRVCGSADLDAWVSVDNPVFPDDEDDE